MLHFDFQRLYETRLPLMCAAVWVINGALVLALI